MRFVFFGELLCRCELSGCPPILGLKQKGRDKKFYCESFNDAIFQFIQERNIQQVFLVAWWGTWFYNNKLYAPDNDMPNLINPEDNAVDATAVNALAETIQRLKDIQVKKIIVMKSIPTATFDPPRALALQQEFGFGTLSQIKISLPPYEEKRQAINLLETYFRDDGDVVFVDPKSLLCDLHGCRVVANDKSLYHNAGHLSAYGATYLEDLFKPYMGSR